MIIILFKVKAGISDSVGGR